MYRDYWKNSRYTDHAQWLDAIYLTDNNIFSYYIVLADLTFSEPRTVLSYEHFWTSNGVLEQV